MKFMLVIIRFLILASFKLAIMLFYRFDLTWLSLNKKQQWRDVNLIILLNHTSLYEVLFIGSAPFSFLWRLASQLILPGADTTLSRPFTGKIIKVLIPGLIPITRKKDDSWQHFLGHVNNDKITAILPEGRMKRRNGLDKTGKEMSIRSGVADILQCLDQGKVLFLYSDGLHHIQAPGEKLPKLFKTIKVTFEPLDLLSYKQQFSSNDHGKFKAQVVNDITARLRRHT